MSKPALEISGARRRFAERKVLHEVSVTVAQGEILALLGPNGAGKTTLMRAAAGRLRLEAGTVRVAGRDPARRAAASSAANATTEAAAASMITRS